MKRTYWLLPLVLLAFCSTAQSQDDSTSSQKEQVSKATKAYLSSPTQGPGSYIPGNAAKTFPESVTTVPLNQTLYNDCINAYENAYSAGYTNMSPSQARQSCYTQATEVIN